RDAGLLRPARPRDQSRARPRGPAVRRALPCAGARDAERGAQRAPLRAPQRQPSRGAARCDGALVRRRRLLERLLVRRLGGRTLALRAARLRATHRRADQLAPHDRLAPPRTDRLRRYAGYGPSLTPP